MRKKTSKPYQALGDFRSIRKKQVTDANGVVRPLIQKPNKFDGKRYGIPQGSPMSAILSNIYMLDFDKYCCELANNFGGIYRRYCDDKFIHKTEMGVLYDLINENNASIKIINFDKDLQV